MVGSLNHVTLSVTELGRSFEFYSRVLGLRPLARWDRGAYLLAGEQTWVCLNVDQRTRSEPSADHSHLAFSVTQPTFAQTVARIRASGAIAWQDNTSEGNSYYFLDPDGHKLEVHVGDWQSRLEACRQRPYDGMVFF
jgi:catechol 2,3-dioxygenase-like lactoylglutathione lyase family enzyme